MTLLINQIKVFNLDESGMLLDPRLPKIIAVKGIKHPTSITTGDKTQITTLACCSAAGYVIPPLVVFDRKTLKPCRDDNWGSPWDNVYGLSSNGWMDKNCLYFGLSIFLCMYLLVDQFCF